MTPQNRHTMTPVPRDHDAVTFSEMVPFRSRNISLMKSPLTLCLILTALIVPLLFFLGDGVLNARDQKTQMQAFMSLTIFSVFLLLFVIQLGVYFYARPGRPIFAYFVPYFAVCVILTEPLLGGPYFYVFRQLLPGARVPEEAPFIQQFISMFFGAGLCEELIKGTATLLCAWAGIVIAKNPQRGNKLTRFVQVRGPLDGVLMGVFAGAGFILLETAMQYVPDMAMSVAKQTNNMGMGLAGGMMLLLPRVLGGMVGHMAYSAIFGYFIGLGVMRPAKFWRLAATGWIASATIHALWNSAQAIHPLMLYVVALIAAVFAAGALLKARHLQQRLFGDTPDSFGSVVIDRRAPGYGGGLGAQPQPSFTPMPPAYTPVAPQMQPQPAPAVEMPLALDIAGLVMPLRANGALVFADEPALGGAGADVRGSIVPHPSRPGVLGLRNSGGAGWTATLRDGQVQRIERDQNIRLAPGVRIDFGQGLVGNVVARG